MQVRPLQDEADVRELTVVHGRAWRAAYVGLLPAEIVDRIAIGPPDEQRVASEYNRLTGYGDGRVFVAEDDGSTVRGYAVFRWGANETKPTVDDGEAELKELYVDPDYWGRGYGTALLNTGIARFPPDIESLALEVLANNEIGIGFYEARGFELAGESTFSVDGQAFPTHVYRRPLP